MSHVVVDWHLALCCNYDPEMFFDQEQEADATAVCLTCKIRWDCLNYALDKPEKFGVWGGMTEQERKNVGFARHRVKCPGCRSIMVSSPMAHVELCTACGLSWKV